MSVSRNTRHQRLCVYDHDIHAHSNDWHGYVNGRLIFISAAEKFHKTAKLLAKFINSINESFKVYTKSNKYTKKEQKDFDDQKQKINQESNYESNNNPQMNDQKDQVDNFKNARGKEDREIGTIVDDGKMDAQKSSNHMNKSSNKRKPLSIEGKTLQKSSFNMMGTVVKLSYNHLKNQKSSFMPKNMKKNSSTPISIHQTVDNPKKEKQNNEANQNVFKAEMKNFLKLSARHVGIAYNIHIQNMKATYDPIHWKQKLEPIPIQLRRIKKDTKIKAAK